MIATKSPKSFYSICKFAGAWENGTINQHGKWLESSIANGLTFNEIESTLQHLTNNNLNDSVATYNIDQISQIFIILKVMATRYKVYMVTEYEVEKMNDNGVLPHTPYIDSIGSICYTSDKTDEGFGVEA